MQTKKIDIVVAPSFTSLRSIQTIIEADKLNLFLSSQNVSEFVEGVYTGEVSSEQLLKLKSLIVLLVILKEEQHFNETDESINLKVHNLINKKITPIICFGESIEQRNSGKYLDYIIEQVDSATKDSEDKVDEIVFAYRQYGQLEQGRRHHYKILLK